MASRGWGWEVALFSPRRGGLYGSLPDTFWWESERRAKEIVPESRNQKKYSEGERSQ